jgi:hypothetical protein
VYGFTERPSREAPRIEIQGLLIGMSIVISHADRKKLIKLSPPARQSVLVDVDDDQSDDAAVATSVIQMIWRKIIICVRFQPDLQFGVRRRGAKVPMVLGVIATSKQSYRLKSRNTLSNQVG